MDKNYESEEGTVGRLVEDELMDDLEYLSGLNPDQAEYTEAIGNIKTLHSMWIEQEKLSLDYWLQKEQVNQLEAANKIKAKDWLNFIMESGKTILPLCALFGITMMGWHNENHPITPSTITSNTTRQSTGILGKSIKF